METVRYSIIIPHKNIPSLLQRCLDSIPEREDIQIIVVDDHSDPDLVDFNHFPGHDRDSVEVHLTKEGKGAGYARNVGLQYAKGGWVIFADADDLFTTELLPFLSMLENEDDDIVYFGIKAVMSDDLKTPSNRMTWNGAYLSSLLNQEKDADNNIRVRWVVPTGKAIKRSFIEQNRLHFSEVRWSNDIFFSISAAVCAKTVSGFNKEVYLLTERENSLTANYCGTLAEMSCRLSEAIKYDRIVKDNGYTFPWKPSTVIVLDYVWRNNGALFWVKSVFYHLFRPVELIRIISFSAKKVSTKIRKAFM